MSSDKLKRFWRFRSCLSVSIAGFTKAIIIAVLNLELSFTVPKVSENDDSVAFTTSSKNFATSFSHFWEGESRKSNRPIVSSFGDTEKKKGARLFRLLFRGIAKRPYTYNHEAHTLRCKHSLLL